MLRSKRWSAKVYHSLRNGKEAMEHSLAFAQGGRLCCYCLSYPIFLTSSVQGYSWSMGLCILRAVMRYLLASIAIFRQLLLAASALGQPSNLRTIVDEAGNRETHNSRKLKWE